MKSYLSGKLFGSKIYRGQKKHTVKVVNGARYDIFQLELRRSGLFSRKIVFIYKILKIDLLEDHNQQDIKISKLIDFLREDEKNNAEDIVSFFLGKDLLVGNMGDCVMLSLEEVRILRENIANIGKLIFKDE